MILRGLLGFVAVLLVVAGIGTLLDQTRATPIRSVSPSPSPWRPSPPPSPPNQPAPLHSGNSYHDSIAVLGDRWREETLRGLVVKAGGACPVATWVAYRDMDEHKGSNWWVECYSQRLFLVTLKNGAGRSARVFACTTTGGIQCTGSQ